LPIDLNWSFNLCSWLSKQNGREECMPKKISIITGDVSLPAELNNGPTAQQIWQALPIEGRVNLWGDEIYFSIPVQANSEPEARAEVEVGELGYWPPGSAFCIFWGPTPASRGSKPRAASPVNIVGQVLGDTTQFKAVSHGAVVRLERAS
jgi:hypothetical protein